MKQCPRPNCKGNLYEDWSEVDEHGMIFDKCTLCGREFNTRRVYKRVRKDD